MTLLPHDTCFAPVKKLPEKVICAWLINLYLNDSQTNTLAPSSFSEYLSNFDPHLHCLLGNLFNQDIDPDLWLSVLQAGTVKVASNSLVKDNMHTYAVVFASGDQVIRFQGPVNCHTTMIQSYRAELTGILAIYDHVNCITDYRHKQIPIKMMAHVNNVLAVWRNNQDNVYPGILAHTASNVGILQEIWTLKTNNLLVTTEWVEAHQDTKYPDRSLSTLAKLNCIADQDASTYIELGHTPEYTPPVLPSAVVTLLVKGVVVTSNIQDILWDASNCTDIQTYIWKKTGWTAELMQNVQWPVLGNVFDSLSLYNKVWVLKFQHKWLPTAA
eukprot:2825805-Ditylum_brightwellii.AAC.1